MKRFIKHQIYIQIEKCHSENSTHINLASCDMYLWRFLEVFGNDENGPIMTQNDPKITILKFSNF